jgi:hypothetical protein
MQPTDECRVFKLKITYDIQSPPTVHVMEPEITKKKHMYSDGRLCLYYPKESPWNYKSNISQTIIPWAMHWIVYYETWLETDIWYGPESPHEGLK